MTGFDFVPCGDQVLYFFLFNLDDNFDGDNAINITCGRCALPYYRSKSDFDMKTTSNFVTNSHITFKE